MSDSRITAESRPNIHDDRGMPARLTYWGIAVGLTLCIVGMGTIVFFSDRIPQALCALTMCVGFGIVLAAFGSHATANWGGWAVIGGAGAITIILFAVVQHYIPTDAGVRNKRGMIGGQLSRVTAIRVIDDDPLYMRYDKNNRKYRFIVPGGKLEAATVSVEVDTIDKGPSELITMTAASERLAKKYFTSNSGIIDWSFDHANKQIKDGQEVVFTVIEEIDEKDFGSGQQSNSRGYTIISSAHAQNIGEIANLNTLIEQLKDDDASARRNARDLLSSSGPEIVPSLMQALHADPSNYRMRLGVVYSFNNQIKRNPELALKISAALSQDDLDLLQAIASDRDPTIRFQATEFLYRLGDKRIVDYAIGNLSSPNVDDISRSNSAIILKGTYNKLPTNDQQNISGKVETLRLPEASKAGAIIRSIGK